MQNPFDEIYRSNAWGYGSGEGSLERNTRSYRAFLRDFILKHRIGSVVDMGCGDWQFSRLIDWGTCRYQGYDVVASVIEANRAAYSKPGISFELYSGNPDELPEADLLIAKDVLQHVPNATVSAALKNLGRYKYALLTNCIAPFGETVNEDIVAGGFRYLDLTKEPFRLAATEVLTFTNYRHPLKALFRRPRWKKHVLLVSNGGHENAEARQGVIAG